MSDLFETEIDSGSKCKKGHALTLVAEGYAYCTSLDAVWQTPVWSAWRLTPPSEDVWGLKWRPYDIFGRDGSLIQAWVQDGADLRSREDCLALIQADIDAHRSLPFDEEAERARLVAV